MQIQYFYKEWIVGIDLMSLSNICKRFGIFHAPINNSSDMVSLVNSYVHDAQNSQEPRSSSMMNALSVISVVIQEPPEMAIDNIVLNCDSYQVYN